MLRTSLRSLCLAAAAACLLSAPSTAKAFWPYLGYGYGTPWNYGYNYGYSTGYMPPPPYYSVYPPVYYAPYIQARHYGASPFAWYPGMEPITYIDVYAGAPTPVPVIIPNPYAPGVAAPAPSEQASTEGKPLRIDNPHVASR